MRVEEAELAAAVRFLIRRRRDRFPGRIFVGSGEPCADCIQVEINHRRGVERQKLRQQQAANDGIAERLAQLRSGAGAKHQGHATEQRCHGRHQDRSEPQGACLINRIFRAKSLIAFDVEREVDQHDARSS